MAHTGFKQIYDDVIQYFYSNENFELDQYIAQLPPELSQEVTGILMNEEREVLHNWEAKNILVKAKEQSIGQYVTETILTLRWYWVNQIIDELKKEISPEADSDNTETMTLIVDYLSLTNVFSKKLGRVISRHRLN